MRRLALSIVIPAWREAAQIGACVHAARAIADEVIVAVSDDDGTGDAARAAGARVVASGRGRGPQLAAGAAAAVGDVLLFLHADVRLGPGARAAIEHALADPAIGGGNFWLRFEPADPWARGFAYLNNTRRRWLRIYYGDSGIFLRRRIYEEIGGFRALPILEDHDLVRRLERAARTVFIRDVAIVASARRFAGRPLRTLAIWTAIQTLGTLGVSPHRLAQLYADIR